MTVAYSAEPLLSVAVTGSDEEPRLAKLKHLIASSLPGAAYLDNTTLRRFLVAEKNDANAAVKRLEAFVSWRRKDGIDDILQTFKFPERDAFLQIYPQGFHHTDRQGRPVYVQQIGAVNHAALSRLITDERMLRYHIREMERFVHVICPACSVAAGRPITQLLSIIDVRGLSFMDLGKVRRLLGLYMQVDAQFYPETLGRLLIINAPSWFASSFQLVKQFMDPNTQAKVEILGSSYTEELLAQVPPEHLLAEYGGKARSRLADDVGPWSDPRYLSDTSSSLAELASPGDRGSAVSLAVSASSTYISTGSPGTIEVHSGSLSALQMRRGSISSSEGGSPARSHRASLSISIPPGGELGQVVQVAPGAAGAAGAGHSRTGSAAGGLPSPFAEPLSQAKVQDHPLGVLGRSPELQRQGSSSLPPMVPSPAPARRSTSGGTGWQHHTSSTLLRRLSSGAAASAAADGVSSQMQRSSFHSAASSNHSQDGTESASGFQTPMAHFSSGNATPSGYSGYATPRAAFASGMATPSSPNAFFTPRGSMEVHSLSSTPRGTNASWRAAPLVQMMHSSLTLAATMHEQQQGSGLLRSTSSVPASSTGGSPRESMAQGAQGRAGLHQHSFPSWREEAEEGEEESDGPGVASCCISLEDIANTLTGRRGAKYLPLESIDCTAEEECALQAHRLSAGSRGSGGGAAQGAGWLQGMMGGWGGQRPKSPKQRLLQQQGSGTWWQWVQVNVCCCAEDGL